MRIFGFHILGTKDQEAKQAKSPKPKATVVPKPAASKVVRSVQPNSSASEVRRAVISEREILIILNQPGSTPGLAQVEQEHQGSPQNTEIEMHALSDTKIVGKKDKVVIPPPRPASERAAELVGKMLHRRPRS